jgi:hypothetical protein
LRGAKGDAVAAHVDLRVVFAVDDVAELGGERHVAAGADDQAELQVGRGLGERDIAAGKGVDLAEADAVGETVEIGVGDDVNIGGGFLADEIDVADRS